MENDLIFENRYLFSKTKVFKNRVEYSVFWDKVIIPIEQIASIRLEMPGFMSAVIETTGGKKHLIATNKKKELQEAIFKAKEMMKMQ